jgi:hypothetical protein
LTNKNSVTICTILLTQIIAFPANVLKPERQARPPTLLSNASLFLKRFPNPQHLETSSSNPFPFTLRRVRTSMQPVVVRTLTPESTRIPLAWRTMVQRIDCHHDITPLTAVNGLKRRRLPVQDARGAAGAGTCGSVPRVHCAFGDIS